MVEKNRCKFLYAVGLAYRNGYGGVAQNYKKAKEYYGKACDLGDADGCKKYAEMKRAKIYFFASRCM